MSSIEPVLSLKLRRASQQVNQRSQGGPAIVQKRQEEGVREADGR